MSNYKVHLNITDKKGNWKRFACNVRGDQDSSHNPDKVTCLKCMGMKNTGVVVEGFGYYFSKKIK